jgi:hypothetical protein
MRNKSTFVVKSIPVVTNHSINKQHSTKHDEKGGKDKKERHANLSFVTDLICK